MGKNYIYKPNKMKINIKGCIMELVGTFALCYVGGLSILGSTGLTGPALAHGLVLGIMIYGGAHLSGAHFNPAVTLALMLIRKCELVEGLLFMAFQLCGGILAGLMLLAYQDGNNNNCYCPTLNGFSMWKGVFLELIATWFLMMAIMGTAVDSKAPKGVFGVAIGGMLTACIFSIGNCTGGALNPTRMIGPSIGAGTFLNDTFYKEFWVYLVGPFLGAILAAFMWQFLFYHRGSDEKIVVVEADREVGNHPPVPIIAVDLSVLARAPPVNNEIKWTGHFFQNGDKFDMELRHMIMDNSGTVTGEGSDGVGDFTIEGAMNDGTLEFKKQYEAHFVNYKGQCTDGSGVFNGTWEIPDDCGGEFSIKCELPRWSGYYVQGGAQNDMALDMSITQEGVYGQGSDVVGFFVCRGECRSNGDILFRKQYVGAHSVDYYGKYEDGKVRGQWVLEGESPEPFELKLE